jgi:hypothetical protein
MIIFELKFHDFISKINSKDESSYVTLKNNF